MDESGLIKKMRENIWAVSMIFIFIILLLSFVIFKLYVQPKKDVDIMTNKTIDNITKSSDANSKNTVNTDIKKILTSQDKSQSRPVYSGGSGGSGGSSGGGQNPGVNTDNQDNNTLNNANESSNILPEDINSSSCGTYYRNYGVCAGQCPSGNCVSEDGNCYCKG